MASQVNELVMDVDDVGKMLNLFQAEKTSLGEATNLWRKLEIDLQWNGNVTEAINSRIKKSYIYHPLALAAHILDRRFMGKGLSEDQFKQGESFIFEELNGSGITSYVEYL